MSGYRAPQSVVDAITDAAMRFRLRSGRALFFIEEAQLNGLLASSAMGRGRTRPAASCARLAAHLAFEACPELRG